MIVCVRACVCIDDTHLENRKKKNAKMKIVKGRNKHNRRNIKQLKAKQFT